MVLLDKELRIPKKERRSIFMMRMQELCGKRRTECITPSRFHMMQKRMLYEVRFFGDVQETDDRPSRAGDGEEGNTGYF